MPASPRWQGFLLTDHVNRNVLIMVVMIVVFIVITPAFMTMSVVSLSVAIVFVVSVSVSVSFMVPMVIMFNSTAVSAPITRKELLSFVVWCYPIGSFVWRPSPISLVPSVMPSYRIPIPFHPYELFALAAEAECKPFEAEAVRQSKCQP
jgi:hypothetical protein